MNEWIANPQRRKILISSSFKWRFSFSSPLASSKIWNKNIQWGNLPEDILIISWWKFCKPPPMSQTGIPGVGWLYFKDQRGNGHSGTTDSPGLWVRSSISTIPVSRSITQHHPRSGISHAMVMEATELGSAWDVWIKFNSVSLKSLATPNAESWRGGTGPVSGCSAEVREA